MGAYLDRPNTKKNTKEDKNARLKYVSSAMQGWRVNMEDAEICDMGLSAGNVQCFGIFDGHGGQEVALFVKKYFVKELVHNKHYSHGNYKQALIDTFMKMDELLVSQQGQKELAQIRGTPGDGESQAGCTGNVVLITPYKIYCANAGDSRAVLYNNGQTVPLSYDHKPDDEKERARITKAGGEVWEGRVNGNLNLSRAIGDLEFKQNQNIPVNQQLIIAEPDVIEYDISKSLPDFIVMGCDGVWETLSNEEAVKYFEKDLRQKAFKKCVEDYLDFCLAKDTTGRFGLDNMSITLIQFFK